MLNVLKWFAFGVILSYIAMWGFLNVEGMYSVATNIYILLGMLLSSLLLGTSSYAIYRKLSLIIYSLLVSTLLGNLIIESQKGFEVNGMELYSVVLLMAIVIMSVLYGITKILLNYDFKIYNFNLLLFIAMLSSLIINALSTKVDIWYVSMVLFTSLMIISYRYILIKEIGVRLFRLRVLEISIYDLVQERPRDTYREATNMILDVFILMLVIMIGILKF